MKSFSLSALAIWLGTAVLATSATVPKSGGSFWETRLDIQLSNDSHDFSIDRCSETIWFDMLLPELYTWIHDELLSIFGQAPLRLSSLRIVNGDEVLARHVALQADFDCRLCGVKQWSSDRSMHNVAYLLQWFIQLVGSGPICRR